MSASPSTAAEPADDAPLGAAVQAGDVHAFDPLVERHLEAVHAFVALKLPVPHLVDEITHETFVFAFRHLAEFTAGTSFRAYGRAVQADPGSALYRFNLGLALRAIGSFERAAEKLAEALRLAPESRAVATAWPTSNPCSDGMKRPSP